MYFFFIDDMAVINTAMDVDLVSCLGVDPGLLSSVEDWLWLAGLGLSLLGLLGDVSNCSVLYCTELYCTALYSTVLYSTYCTVFYCTILFIIVRKST